MSPEELQQSIKQLESALDNLGVWLLVAIALVVLGLVLEYAHQIPESIATYKKERTIWPLLVIVGGILITVGVAGELLIQHLASPKETALRKANDELVGLLNLKTANALQEAARLGKVAEDEKLERIKLEAAVAPRSLSLNQQKSIAEAVQKFRGHGVLVSSYGIDGEGAALAGQLITCLSAVGIVVADARASIVVAGGFETGIHIRGPAAEQNFVLALSSAMSEMGKLKVAVNDAQPRIGAAIDLTGLN